MGMRFIDKILKRKETKEKLKLQGKNRFLVSVGHAMDGIEYTCRHERNFRIELVFTFFVFVASVFFIVSVMEWVILLLTIALVLVCEVINTAVERCVDLVTKEYHDLARIAKDVSAGAVFLVSLFSVVIGVSIFLPKIMIYFK